MERTEVIFVTSQNTNFACVCYANNWTEMETQLGLKAAAGTCL